MTGASGSIYGLKLLEAALPFFDPLYLVLSARAREVMSHELGIDPGSGSGAAVKLLGEKAARVRAFSPKTMNAPFASGSAVCDTMVVAPCTMGTLSRIANGVSDDLITRAADVAMKERRKLILVPRETPYSTLHLRNMLALSEAGVVIMPASPPFYHRPENLDDLVKMVTDRILAHAGVRLSASYRWAGSDAGERE
jgi:4-hydroxy-3-polyprenylbenzoate decarboxylase